MNTQVYVENIKCGGCAKSITSKVEKISNISNVNVDVNKGMVSFDAQNQESIDAVKLTLKKMGYPEGDSTLIESAKSYVSCMIGRIKE